MPFQAAYIVDDIDDVYWAHERLLTDIINEHAPVKERVTKAKKACLYERQPQTRCFQKTYAFQ